MLLPAARGQEHGLGISRGLCARFSELLLSVCRLVPSEEVFFHQQSLPAFEPHLKRNVQRPRQPPQTPFSKGGCLPAPGTYLLFGLYLRIWLKGGGFCGADAPGRTGRRPAARGPRLPY